jgi:hypothetical protein
VVVLEALLMRVEVVLGELFIIINFQLLPVVQFLM